MTPGRTHAHAFAETLVLEGIAASMAALATPTITLLPRRRSGCSKPKPLDGQARFAPGRCAPSTMSNRPPWSGSTGSTIPRSGSQGDSSSHRRRGHLPRPRRDHPPGWCSVSRTTRPMDRRCSRPGAPCSDTSRRRLRTPLQSEPMANAQPTPMANARPRVEEPGIMTEAPDVADAYDD